MQRTETVGGAAALHDAPRRSYVLHGARAKPGVSSRLPARPSGRQSIVRFFALERTLSPRRASACRHDRVELTRYAIRRGLVEA
jgi:hypothetical protein